MLVRLFLFLFILSCIFLRSAIAQESRGCLIQVANAPRAYIDSISKDVQVRRVEGGRVRAYPNMLLCPGDTVRTGGTGRVAIRFEGKRTIVRLDGNSQARITTTHSAEADITLQSGILYFLSSVRDFFRVDTPLMVAGIEGTEALVAVLPSNRGAMTVVRQGIVTAYDKRIGQQSRLKVFEGEAAFVSDSLRIQKAAVGALRPPFRELLIASESAVDWAVYYPPVLLAPAAEGNAIRRAVILMASGDYDKASSALDGANRISPATAAALRVIIAIGRNRLAEAKFWANKALEIAPESASAHISASYNSQAHGDLEKALVFATKAVRLSPKDPYALARLAELEMIVGDRLAALKYANAALEIERIPLALFVAGLAKLVATDYESASQDFEEAKKIDSEAPLPRLGLGLTAIRMGDLAKGAWEIERALAHDPRRAALRTWLGRAYFDEGETKKASDAFRQSKGEDPEAPSPYIFAAFERYAANSPVEGIKEVIEAEKRAKNRKVLRSSLGLGEDAAVHGAAQGRLFDTLNFDSIATISASKASDKDPGNPAAHRFLADAYRLDPKAGVAQTSELLRAQLLSPQSKSPVQPQLAEARLSLLDTTGASRVTFAEFAPLFEGDGVRLDASGLYGTQDTRSYEASVSGVYKRTSASVGYFDYETDGYRANNDLKHNIFNAVSTIAVTPEFTLFGEYRKRESEGGDRRLNFNLEDFNPSTRLEEEREVSRIGFHIRPSRKSDIIGVYSNASFLSETFDRNVIPGDNIEVFPGFFISTPDTITETTSKTEFEGSSAELQYLRHDGPLRTVIGGAFKSDDQTPQTEVNITVGPSATALAIPLQTLNTKSHNIYAYTYLTFPWIDATLGASYIDLQNDGDLAPEFSEVLPKLGITANLGDHVQVRAAYLKSLSSNLVTEQTIEPTQVAGFNQFYDAFDGSVLEQTGLGIDIKPTDWLWFGGSYINRSWDIPLNGETYGPTEEKQIGAYFYATLSERFAFSAEWRKEKTSSDVLNDFDHWKTESIPLTIKYFGTSRFFASATLEFVKHSIEENGVSQKSDFKTIGASLGYRLRNNRGVVSIEVLNALNDEILFQNRDIRLDLTEAPTYSPSRTVYARGVIRF